MKAHPDRDTRDAKTSKPPTDNFIERSFHACPLSSKTVQIVERDRCNMLTQIAAVVSRYSANRLRKATVKKKRSRE